MRNLADSQTFITETEKILKDELNTNFSTEVLSRITPSAIGALFTNSFRITDWSFTNVLTLIILSWYVPEEIGILLRLEIEDHILDGDLSFLDFLVRKSAVRGLTLVWLLDTSLLSTRDFFGNILNSRNIRKALLSIKPIMYTKRKPKRVQRHRGYRDKGTLRKDSEKHDLWISTAEQMKIEESRLSSCQTLDFIEGWVT